MSLCKAKIISQSLTLRIALGIKLDLVKVKRRKFPVPTFINNHIAKITN